MLFSSSLVTAMNTSISATFSSSSSSSSVTSPDSTSARSSALGEQLAAALVVLDDLDRVVLLQRARQAPADVAAAADHHPAHRLVHAPQLAHDLADVLGGGEAEHLVAGFDHGVALGQRSGCRGGRSATMRASTSGHVRAQFADRLADQRPAVERAHRHQAHAAVGEFEHLQRLGELDQLDDVVGEHLLRADGEIHREVLAPEHLLGPGGNRRRAPARCGVGTLNMRAASLQATRLVSSLCVTATSRSASSMPASRSTDGCAALPVTVRRSRRSCSARSRGRRRCRPP